MNIIASLWQWYAEAWYTPTTASGVRIAWTIVATCWFGIAVAAFFCSRNDFRRERDADSAKTFWRCALLILAAPIWPIVLGVGILYLLGRYAIHIPMLILGILLWPGRVAFRTVREVNKARVLARE